jgi:lipoate-protein ligase B
LLFDLGFRQDYQQVWDFQRRLVGLRQNDLKQDCLVMVEHSHVLTLGRNGKKDNILSDDLSIFEIERGGDVTYHGPGQLVAYPIISLRERSLGTKQYVELLERVIVDALSSFGITAEGKLGIHTGVWTNTGKKIASIGVAASHWITYHGFALNVSTNLSYFSKIRPCGFESNVMTSMSQELGTDVEISDVKPKIVECFSRNFGPIVSEPRSQNDF